MVFYALPYLSSIPSDYFVIIKLLPSLAIVTGMVLAWRFNRSRIFFLLVVVLALYICLSLRPGNETQVAHWLTLVASLLLPLNFLLLSIAKERGIFTSHGAIRLTFLTVQGLVAWWLITQNNVSLFDWLETSWLDHVWAIKLESIMPQSTWFIFIVAVAWQITQIFFKSPLIESGVLSALMMALLSTLPSISGEGISLLLGISGVTLIITLVQESYSMAYLDELTGLPGRRAIEETLVALGSRYSIAMLDVDHFKKFNDTYGHDVGDQVLRMVATKIKTVGGGGQPGRYGGEEFAIIFPNKSVSDAFTHLEIVRQRIAETPFTVRGKNRPKEAPEKPIESKGSKQVTVTISIGVAERTAEASTPYKVMKDADKALYRAKENGRNQVCK